MCQGDPKRVALGDRLVAIHRRPGGRVLDGDLFAPLELAEGMSPVVLQVDRQPTKPVMTAQNVSCLVKYLVGRRSVKRNQQLGHGTQLIGVRGAFPCHPVGLPTSGGSGNHRPIHLDLAVVCEALHMWVRVFE